MTRMKKVLILLNLLLDKMGREVFRFFMMDKFVEV